MKKTHSKQKTGTNSKRQRSKKLTKKHQNRQGSKLCSCFDHQPSPDSSYENVIIESASHIERAKTSQINLPVPAYMKQWTSEEEFTQRDVTMVTDRTHRDLTERSTGTCTTGRDPNSQNTTSGPISHTNHHSARTNSCELVGLFYTIVADDCLLSQPSDSEDSDASDIILNQEIEADVHYGSNKSGMLKDVDKENEQCNHSDVDIQILNKDKAEADTWFAFENEPLSNIDPRSEEVSNFKEVIDETLNCNQNLNDETGTIGIGCTKDTHQPMGNLCANFPCQDNHENLFQEMEGFVDATTEDYDSNSNISVETVKDATLSCHSVKPGDMSFCVSETSSIEFPDSNRIASSNISTENCEDFGDNSTVDNTVDHRTNVYDQTTHPQSLNNSTTNSQEGSYVFSQDQAVTEIITRGRRMADEVRQLISELLDVCIQSRGNDTKSVAGNGDFEDAPAAPSLAACEIITDSTDPEDGDHRQDISQGCDQTVTDISTDQFGDCIAPGRENEKLFCAETLSEFYKIEVGDNRREINELPIIIDELPEVQDTPVDQSRNNSQLLRSEPVSIGPEILKTPCEGFNQPKHMEANGTSGNNQRQLNGPSDSNLNRDIEMENVIGNGCCDTGHAEDVDERNLTNLSTSNSQHNTSDTTKDEGVSAHISDNFEPETRNMLHPTDVVWPVRKVIGYDITDNAQLQENNHARCDPVLPHVVKIIGVDVHPDSQTGKANSSEELDIQEDEHTPLPFENDKFKIIGIDVENPNLDSMTLCDIKIVGFDVEIPLPDEVTSDRTPGDVPVNEEGDSARSRDTNLPDDVKSEPNKNFESSELGHKCTNNDPFRADKDTSSDDMISQESGDCGITETDRFNAQTAESRLDSHLGQDTADRPAMEASGQGESNPCQDVLRPAHHQEPRIPADCYSSPRESSPNSPGYLSSPCSSFEIIDHQEVIESNFMVIPYSPSIHIPPPPQQEYNEELMSPEFETDDIIVNFAAVSAMGDVVFAPRRSGISPSPPEPVQFEDVNSRSPSPLPQNDVTLLDCLFDICEESLQRFPLKWPPPGERISVKYRSPCKLSLDCIENCGDRIQSVDNEQSSDISKELFGSMSGEDEGFFCCEPDSIESHCSFTSAETAPESSPTDYLSEKYLSFDNLVEVKDESPYEETASSPEIVPGFGCRTSDQGILDGVAHSSNLFVHTDQTLSSQGLKEPNLDTKGDLVSTNTADLDKDVDEEDNFVFFLALLTLSLFLYCKYGTSVLQTILHWMWICQLIIQLLTDS